MGLSAPLGHSRARDALRNSLGGETHHRPLSKLRTGRGTVFRVRAVAEPPPAGRAKSTEEQSREERAATNSRQENRLLGRPSPALQPARGGRFVAARVLGEAKLSERSGNAPAPLPATSRSAARYGRRRPMRRRRPGSPGIPRSSGLPCGRRSCGWSSSRTSRLPPGCPCSRPGMVRR